MKTQQKLAYLCLAAIMLFASIFAPTTAATPSLDDLQAQNAELRDKIAALNSQIRQYEGQASELAKNAASIENRIAMLQTEQANLRAKIDLKEAEHEQLELDIKNIETRLEKNSHIISLVISQYYYNSEVSTVERLASSESFSSYLDNEMRLSTMADSVVAIIEENKRLREESIVKKERAEQILADLETQRNELSQKRAEQNNLLAQTRRDEAAYLEQKEASEAQKSVLEDEQARVLALIMAQNGGSPLKPGDPNKGGYPYSSQCPAAKINHRQYADRWGMYICECVSYTAWRVEAAYGYMPYWGGRGNANQWINSARQDGYKVSNIPKPGAVGISMAGPWGHAVWVEAVNGNRVYISQYNYRINGVPGQYSEMEVSASAYTYIYFDEKVK